MIDPYVEISKLRQYFYFAFALMAGFGAAIGLLLGIEAYGASQFGSGAQIALQAISTYEQHYAESRDATDRTTKAIEDFREELKTLTKRFDEMTQKESQRETATQAPESSHQAKAIKSPPLANDK